MSKAKVIAALMTVVLLLFSAAAGETWKAAEENLPLFRMLLDRLDTDEKEPAAADRAETENILAEIRRVNKADYEVGRAITDHWFGTVRNSGYRRFTYRGEETAVPLERSGLDFSGKHAFVVMGYQLQDGEMKAELTGRCDAAAAAACSFPDAVLICTGGATGMNNPEERTEAGEMKKYLTRTCGIDARRIFTDEAAMTTLENALNTFRILKQEGVHRITIVTSDYHQLWAQVLFNAVAAVWKTAAGYEVSIVGNYNLPVRDAFSGARSGLSQLMSLLRGGVPVEP